jgi:hypothetical protein
MTRVDVRRLGVVVVEQRTLTGDAASRLYISQHLWGALTA